MVKNEEMNHASLKKFLSELSFSHPVAQLSYIGESVLGREIPLITLGEQNAPKSVLYVATHHACESICTSLLVKFLTEYVSLYEKNGSSYQININALHKMRKIYIVPMLNPDGVEYRLNGVGENNPIRERVIAYNGGEDFSLWQANARGVDLNHNYNAFFDEYKELEKERGITQGRTKYSGEYPESEPETAALCSFIRYILPTLEGVITLHTQGEEIYYSSRGKLPKKSVHVSKILSKMTRYNLCEPSDTACYGGLTDYLITTHDIPAFTVECGRGTNPLPYDMLGKIYTDVREMLFTFPILF